MKTVFLFISLLISLIGWSQFDHGLKSGVSFPASGKVEDIAKDFQTHARSLENATGYTIGAYAAVDILFLYIRPELQYSRYKKSFKILTFKQSKLDIPVSVGYRVLPFLSVFAGPTFEFYLFENSSDVNLEASNKRKNTSLHMGTRLEFGSIGLELRYERGFKANEVHFLQNNGVNVAGQLDTKLNQWVLGISYSLYKTKRKKMRYATSQ